MAYGRKLLRVNLAVLLAGILLASLALACGSGADPTATAPPLSHCRQRRLRSPFLPRRNRSRRWRGISQRRLPL